MHNNANLDLVNINAYAKFGQIPSICTPNILSGNKIRAPIKDHKFVIICENWRVIIPT